MKKADIVASAKENGLDLDINLTKVKLIEAWDLHFNQSSLSSAVDDAATVMAEVAAKEESEEVPAEEEPPELYDDELYEYELPRVESFELQPSSLEHVVNNKSDERTKVVIDFFIIFFGNIMAL